MRVSPGTYKSVSIAVLVMFLDMQESKCLLLQAFTKGRSLQKFLLVKKLRLSRCHKKTMKVAKLIGFTNLGVFFRNSVENGAVCAISHAALLPRLWVVLVALSKTLRAKIVGIAKWLVDALKRFVSCHEDLNGCEFLGIDRRSHVRLHTRSKAVEQALG
jgi:hypothetical protein